MKIHSYFNSSTSFRVRIALALKGVEYDCIPVNLRTQSQRDREYVALNPSAGVPLLTDGDFILSQSLAIIDYLDARFPAPRLVPQESRERARVLELSQGIACDIHPLNNMRVLMYLKNVLGVTDEQKQAWYEHWVAEGLSATEQLLARLDQGPYCLGSEPTLADCCLVPQVYNALRVACPVERFPRVMAIYAHCMEQPAFQRAAPANQPDYVA